MQVIQSWKEYFENFLTSEQQQDVQFCENADNRSNGTHTDLPSLEEVQEAVNKLKLDKSVRGSSKDLSTIIRNRPEPSQKK